MSDGNLGCLRRTRHDGKIIVQKSTDSFQIIYVKNGNCLTEAEFEPTVMEKNDGIEK
jgi:hypothetical protein